MSPEIIRDADSVPGVIARLFEDHQLIQKIMRCLEVEINDLRDAGIRSSYEILGRLVDCMSRYGEASHHPLEDRVFDRVLHTGLSPTERHLVFQNLGQHQEILTSARALRRDLELANSEEPGESASGLLDAAEAYLRQKRTHMAFEETQLFPLAQYRLSNSDWNDLSMELAESEDPAKHPRAARQLAELRGLCRRVVEEVVA